jgi:hypothetical protein
MTLPSGWQLDVLEAPKLYLTPICAPRTIFRLRDDLSTAALRESFSIAAGPRVARGVFREVVPLHRLACSFGWEKLDRERERTRSARCRSSVATAPRRPKLANLQQRETGHRGATAR